MQITLIELRSTAHIRHDGRVRISYQVSIFCNVTSSCPFIPMSLSGTQQGLLSKLEQVCASHTTPPVNVTDRVHSCLYPTNYPDGTGLVFRFGCIFIFLLLICWLLELVTNRHFGNEMCLSRMEGQIIHLRGLNPATLSLVHPWMTWASGWAVPRGRQSRKGFRSSFYPLFNEKQVSL